MSENKFGSESLGQMIETQLELNPTSERSVLKEKIGDCLKGIGAYNKSNLYRFIPSENQSRNDLTAKGTDHPEFNTLFAFGHGKIFKGSSSLLPVEYLFNYGGKDRPYTCMIAVYDGGQFIDDGDHHYTFTDPGNKLTALKAVVYIKPKA